MCAPFEAGPAARVAAGEDRLKRAWINGQGRLADAPAVFAGYEPENLDRAFHGEVTAGQALQYSLNVPAVAMLAKVGADAFEARLEGVGSGRRSRPQLTSR